VERDGGTSRPFYASPYVWAFLAGIVLLTLMRPLLRYEPDPPPVLGQLPEFRLVDDRGRPFGSAELAGQVWVGNLFFTRCRSICPVLTAAMGRLQDRYDEYGIEGIRLVSISVDPLHDTPERLREYAGTWAVDERRWTLLTGEPERIERLAVEGFKSFLGPAAADEQGGFDIAHLGKLVLVDGQGRIRGYYDADPAGLDEVFHRSQHVLRER
jgi:protein SCO1/2